MVDFQFYQLSFLFVLGAVGVESTVCSTAVCAFCRQCARTMGFFSTSCAGFAIFAIVFGVAELQARVAAHWTWIVDASLDALHADVDVFRYFHCLHCHYIRVRGHRFAIRHAREPIYVGDVIFLEMGLYFVHGERGYRATREHEFHIVVRGMRLDNDRHIVKQFRDRLEVSVGVLGSCFYQIS